MKKSKKTVDAGRYNRDKELLSSHYSQYYRDYPDGVTLPPEIAELVDKNMIRLLIRLARYKFVARIVKPSDTVLDVGCGLGLGDIFLGQHAGHVTGIDIREHEIAEARSVNRRDNVTFKVIDLYNLPRNRKFDVVIALDVIEHMAVEDGRKLLKAMATHLKPDGMAVIGTPSIYSYPYQGHLSQAGHIKCYDQKELTDLMESVFGRTVALSMNDEVVHTGHPKMSWYYFVLAFNPKK